MGQITPTKLQPKTKILKVHCHITNYNFLIDTGSTVSIIPANKFDDTETDGILYAANNTKIFTKGQKTLKINLGLGRTYTHEFIVANINQPIIGADFLSNFRILINIYEHKIYDEITGRNTNTYQSDSSIANIKTTTNRQM